MKNDAIENDVKNSENSINTLSSTMRRLIHSFSWLVSNETESIQRWRQKFRALNQSTSTPFNAGSRHEKKYPFWSGARSWMVRWAHNAATGASKTWPSACWAKQASTNKMKQTIAENTFILRLRSENWRKTIIFSWTINRFFFRIISKKCQLYCVIYEKPSIQLSSILFLMKWKIKQKKENLIENILNHFSLTFKIVRKTRHCSVYNLQYTNRIGRRSNLL